MELLDLNVWDWVLDSAIDKAYDEWSESSKGYMFDDVDCGADRLETFRIDAERLWELLFQRGYVELEVISKPVMSECFYLILFVFCRLVFDSGGMNRNSRTNFVHPGENDAVEEIKVVYF